MKTKTLLLCVLFAAACDKTSSPAAPTEAPKPTEGAPTAAMPAPAPTPAPTPTPAAAPVAIVGQAAPDFTLKDLDGKDVALASFKGKTVVLEWFNPACPFVKKSHSKGSLVDTAKKVTANGVVWLAINSGAPGKQGYEVADNVAAVKELGIGHPVLRDETGAVGKAYGATNTPHMFVIDPKGTVVYAGAIDNSPDAEKGAPEGGTLINYVEAALADVAAGKPVATPTHKAYGCSVKYGS